MPRERRPAHASRDRGRAGDGTQQLLELRLALASNPALTASVLVAYARAAYRLHARGEVGATTVLESAPAPLSPRSIDELRRGCCSARVACGAPYGIVARRGILVCSARPAQEEAHATAADAFGVAGRDARLPRGG